jgi:hypothetical protein
MAFDAERTPISTDSQNTCAGRARATITWQTADAWAPLDAKRRDGPAIGRGMDHGGRESVIVTAKKRGCGYVISLNQA